jgi:ElaB/YqjD/DUF883 family membrane-anchored ribosome-binding protein
MSRRKDVVERVMSVLSEAESEVDDVLKEVTRLAEEKAAKAKAGVGEGIDRAESVLRDMGGMIAGEACSANRTLRTGMREHPFAFIGSALAIGLLAGVLCRHCHLGRH